ncbi:hypothetical protein GGR21_000027 [Dysgonomonas hofstadii]|uniref:Uncharacterized protein n=1 Tax=Dysgonomonas hofstadii TaxID=637886 RepID=A0A840CNI6_9BACT|nr:hypothetical protein [Dysgonomonas hofstadii]
MFTQLKRKNAVIYSITTFYEFLKVVPPEKETGIELIRIDAC